MERLIKLGMTIIKDAYNNEHAYLEDYLGNYSMEELTDFRLFRMLNKYGRFLFQFEDKIWTNYKLTYTGKTFVEKGCKLEYKGEAIESDWLGLGLMAACFSIAGSVISVSLYYLTSLINNISKDIVLMIFFAITALILLVFCSYYRHVHEQKMWEKCRLFLILSASALLYMIIYESICLSEEVVGLFPWYIQLGCTGVILWHLCYKNQQNTKRH